MRKSDRSFRLDPRIEASSLALGRLLLCSIRIMNDKRFPWLLLVPERAGLREIHDLPPPLRGQLVEEIAAASRALLAVSRAEKMNVGALGNLVPQLHIHVIARFAADPAWPGPVWSFAGAVPYNKTEADDFAAQLGAGLPSLEPAVKPT
jgi:diadenosine tetraphosphate (Ap4A) HIT family hydrolase